MAIISLPLVGSGTQSENIQLNPSQLVNLYETTSFGVDGVRSKSGLLRTPGTQLFFTLPNNAAFRGWITINSTLWVVAGNTLYSVTSTGTGLTWSGTITSINTIGTTTGRVSMAYNGLQLMLDDGTNGYYYKFSDSSFHTIVDGNYISSGFITYQADTVVYSQPNTNTIWIGNLNDVSTWSAQNFGSMESDPQTVVCAFATPSNLFVFGQSSTEVWAQDGAQFFPYQPIQGINIPYGCASRDSVCYTNGTIVWLTKNKQGKALLVGLGSGQTLQGFGGFIPQPLLDEAGSYQLQQLTTLSDAKAATFQINGHIFYAITFPTDNKTFLLDVATKKFIQWQSWFTNTFDSSGNPIYTLGRHLFDDIIEFNGNVLVADYRGIGNILVMSTSIYTDYNAGVQNSIPVVCTLPGINSEGKRITINSIEIDCEKGTSTYSDQDIVNNPALNQALLSVSLSKDGGRNNTYTRQASLGYKGDFTTRVKLNCWGDFRYGALTLAADHPSKIAIYNVLADIEIEDQPENKSNG